MLSKMWNLCRDYKYISFDIFDTLIKRFTEQPKDVFKIVQIKYEKKYGTYDKIPQFSEVRVESERIARSKNNREITFDDIYVIIGEKYNESLANRYKTLEIETELEVCVANPRIKPLYQQCISDGKTVYITTDMYIPRMVIEKILINNGYTGYKRIFLSCESGNTKAAGTLYTELINEEKIKANELVHIGDNFHSDIINAKKKDIRTIYVKKSAISSNLILDKSIEKNFLYNFIRYTNPYDEIFSNIGYSCFGPLLYGFIDWISKSCFSMKHEKIFFLSRDGFIMKKVYESIKDKLDIDSYYFYASRRALQVAAIQFNSDFEDVMKHMFIPRFVSVRWLLKRWGLEPNNYVTQVIKEKLKMDDELSGTNIIDDLRIKNLYAILREDIIRNSRNEYKAFKKYLDENDFKGDVAIVDIGWYGNMQNSLITMLTHMEHNVNVTGYYLGIVPESDYQNKYNMHGYLFERGKNEKLFYRFKYLNSLMELFFMAPHGSAKRYCVKDEKVNVELSSFEYENTYTFEMIKKLQFAALDFIDNYKKVSSYIDLSERIYLSPLLERFVRPDFSTARSFGDLQMWDDKWIPIADKDPVYKWIVNPKASVKKFLSVPWKMGYLKRNIRIPLRYDLIVFNIRVLYKKYQ